MLRLYTQSEAENGLPESLDEAEPGVADLLRGIEAGETPIIAVHAAKSARSGFLDLLLPALRQDGVRPVLVSSLDGGEIGLATLMDQVVGSVCADPSDRLERCHVALTILAPAEKRIALVIDDAHLLADQSVRYLDLTASVARSSHVPLLILLVGSPAIWDRLPLTGGLAAENVARRMILDGATPSPEPAAPPDLVPVGPVGQSLQIVEMVRAARTVPVVISPEPAKRAWLALAACAGSFFVAGGVAADLYLEGPLTSRALFPRVMATQVSTVAAPASLAVVATPFAPASPIAVVQQAEASAAVDAPDGDAASAGAASSAVAPGPIKAEGSPPPDQAPMAEAEHMPPAPVIATAVPVAALPAAALVAPTAVPATVPPVPTIMSLPGATVSVSSPPAPPVVTAKRFCHGDRCPATARAGGHRAAGYRGCDSRPDYCAGFGRAAIDVARGHRGSDRARGCIAVGR